MITEADIKSFKEALKKANVVKTFQGVQICLPVKGGYYVFMVNTEAFNEYLSLEPRTGSIFPEIEG